MHFGPRFSGADLGRREHGRVEGDVVFAEELVQLDVIGVVPPLLPFRVVVCGDEDIADASVEPRIDDFVLVARQRDWRAPFDVSGDAPRLQPLLQPGRSDVLAAARPRALPRGLAVELRDLGPQLVQLQEDVRAVPCRRCCAVELAPRLFQLQGIEELAAPVALIAAGVGVATGRALALHEAIGQERAMFGTEELRCDLLRQEAIGAEFEEDVLGGLGLLRGGGAPEDVEGDVEPGVDGGMDSVVLVEELLGRVLLGQSFGLVVVPYSSVPRRSSESDAAREGASAQLTAHVEGVRAPRAQVPRKHVRRQHGPHNVAEVGYIVHIGEGRGHQHIAFAVARQQRVPPALDAACGMFECDVKGEQEVGNRIYENAVC